MKAITCSLVVCGAVNLTLAMNLIDFIALTRLTCCVCKWQAVCNTQKCIRAVQFMIYDFSHFVPRHSCDWIGLALPHLPPLTNKLSYCVAQYLHGVRFFMPSLSSVPKSLLLLLHSSTITEWAKEEEAVQEIYLPTLDDYLWWLWDVCTHFKWHKSRRRLY